MARKGDPSYRLNLDRAPASPELIRIAADPRPACIRRCGSEPAYAPVTESRFGDAGVNSPRGPGIRQLGLRPVPRIPLTERYRLQFRAEPFVLVLS